MESPNNLIELFIILMDAKHLLRQRIGVLSSSGADERVTVKLPSTKMADSDIGVGTLLVEKRNPSLVGVQKPDARETAKAMVPTYPRQRDNRSRQAG
jgi:hypothetical protein